MPPERAGQHRNQRHQREGHARSTALASRLCASAIHFGHRPRDHPGAGAAGRASVTSLMSAAALAVGSGWRLRRSIVFWVKVSMSSRPVWRSISWRLPLNSSTRGPFASFHQPAALGQDRRMGASVARVVDQDAAQRAVRVARADIDRHLVRDRGEHALLQQEGRDLVADLPLELAERPQAGRHQTKD